MSFNLAISVCVFLDYKNRGSKFILIIVVVIIIEI